MFSVDVGSADAASGADPRRPPFRDAEGRCDEPSAMAFLVEESCYQHDKTGRRSVGSSAAAGTEKEKKLMSLLSFSAGLT